jgi:hypothetical protein
MATPGPCLFAWNFLRCRCDGWIVDLTFVRGFKYRLARLLVAHFAGVCEEFAARNEKCDGDCKKSENPFQSIKLERPRVCCKTSDSKLE